MPEPVFCVGDRVVFSSVYLHTKMGERSFAIVDRIEEDGEWWYSIDKRNYLTASYFCRVEAEAFPEVRR